MKRSLFLSILLLPAMAGWAGGASAASGAVAAPGEEVLVLPRPGEKVPLDREHYFVYGFTVPPRLGTAVMKVTIFERGGAREDGYAVAGDADMPSMRGHHSSGMRSFARSKKGDYLLPVSLVMPGTWEIRMTFRKDGRTVLTGIHLFDL